MAIVVPFMLACLLLKASQSFSEDYNFILWDGSWSTLCAIVGNGMTF